MIALTDKGRELAVSRAKFSMVAKVALTGSVTGWPESHVAAAIKTMNEEAEKSND